MLTPKFALSQDEEFVLLEARCPYIKAQDLELDIEGTTFQFHCKPYLLRLQFDQEVTEEGAKASYDVDSGQLSVRIPKQTKGENFTSLDLLTRLVTRREPSKPPAGGGIEVLSSTTFSDEDDQEGSDNEAIGGADATAELGLGAPCYGFNNSFSRAFHGLQEGEIAEIVQLPTPDETPIAERNQMRSQAEEAQFDPGQYLFDRSENEELSQVVDFVCFWTQEHKAKKDQGAAQAASSSYFDEDERDELVKLPRKEFLLTSSERDAVVCSLVGLLFPIAYDVRTTLGEATCESGWTIATLSPLLSCWELARRVHRDTLVIVRNGRPCIIRCLLHARQQFRKGDRDLLNRLYIDQYCAWLQSLSEEASQACLTRLGDQIARSKVTKADMQLGLVELETRADEESESDDSDDDDSDDSDESDESDDEGDSDEQRASGDADDVDEISASGEK